MNANVETLADALWAARQGGPPAPAPVEAAQQLDLPTAYQVQFALARRYAAAGARHIGMKIGMTSTQAQEACGCTEPVFGHLFDTLVTGPTVRLHGQPVPRVEPEIVLVLQRPLYGSDVDAAAVMAAAAEFRLGIELVRPAYAPADRDVRNIVADNVTCAGVLLGPTLSGADPADLSGATMVLEHNGSVAGTGTAAAVMGHPAAAAAWLVRRLAAFDRGLAAGDIVFTGTWVPALAVAAGDRVRAGIAGLGAVELLLEP